MIAKKSIKGKYAGKCPECGIILIENEIKCPKCALVFDEPAKAQTANGEVIEDNK